jgi:glucoamylase
VALPVLLAAKLAELREPELPGTREMVRAAVGFLARSGPASAQDRWEENPGVSPFTLATAIAALVAAGPWLLSEEREYALELADDWNERLESWCYVENTELARTLKVRGYYVRLSPPHLAAGDGIRVERRNRDGATATAAELVSLDFSYLVRLGIRSALDPRVQDTIRVIDRILTVQTPSGTLYRRYNGDGYGEHVDGHPFDGQGIGRAWPLLVGERGHLALQSGEDALPFLETMWRCASTGGMLPEQVWDADPIPALELTPGRPSGSAMPLVWAHAEFLKLLVARERGRPVEWLASVEQHFGHRPLAHDGEPVSGKAAALSRSAIWHWRDEVPVTRLPAGKSLAIEDRVPFKLHLGFDGWQRIEDRAAEPSAFGIWSVVLAEHELLEAQELNFTRKYESGWEGRDQCVALERSEAVPSPLDQPRRTLPLLELA